LFIIYIKQDFEVSLLAILSSLTLPIHKLDKSLSQRDNLWVITNAISTCMQTWMAVGAFN
jgi:hypothetical protein